MYEKEGIYTSDEQQQLDEFCSKITKDTDKDEALQLFDTYLKDKFHEETEGLLRKMIRHNNIDMEWCDILKENLHYLYDHNREDNTGLDLIIEKFQTQPFLFRSAVMESKLEKYERESNFIARADVNVFRVIHNTSGTDYFGKNVRGKLSVRDALYVGMFMSQNQRNTLLDYVITGNNLSALYFLRKFTERDGPVRAEMDNVIEGYVNKNV